MSSLNVFKRRTNEIPFNLGIDVSDSSFVSEIREGKDNSSQLIATWTVSFETDGTDGRLIFTLDDADLQSITQTRGYMDIKQVKDGEPYPVLADPITVRFKDSVTS